MKKLKGFTPLEVCSRNTGDQIFNSAEGRISFLGKPRSRLLKGFTLVEVLIVVVIIAILASLVMPRMLAQTERAKASEAFQMFGVIRRAGERTFSLTNSYAIPSWSLWSDPGVLGTPWGELGLQDLGKSKNWGSYYEGGDTYMYAYVFDPDWTDYVGLYVDSSSGPQWDCSNNVIKPKTDANGNVIGCTI